METINEYCYEIDARDVIVDVGTSWLAFAKHNDAAELIRTQVEGHHLHLFIAGWKLSELYEQLFAALRRSGRSTMVPFRCDSAEVKQFMELQLTPHTWGCPC